MTAALQLLAENHYLDIPPYWLSQPFMGELRIGLVQ